MPTGLACWTRRVQGCESRAAGHARRWRTTKLGFSIQIAPPTGRGTDRALKQPQWQAAVAAPFRCVRPPCRDQHVRGLARSATQDGHGDAVRVSNGPLCDSHRRAILRLSTACVGHASTPLPKHHFAPSLCFPAACGTRREQGCASRAAGRARCWSKTRHAPGAHMAFPREQ